MSGMYSKADRTIWGDAARSANVIFDLTGKQRANLQANLNGPWIGKLLRYEAHSGDNTVPVFLIQEGWDAFDLENVAVHMVELSGDTHHRFLEAFVESPDGVHLDIQTGS